MEFEKFSKSDLPILSISKKTASIKLPHSAWSLISEVRQLLTVSIQNLWHGFTLSRPWHIEQNFICKSTFLHPLVKLNFWAIFNTSIPNFKLPKRLRTGSKTCSKMPTNCAGRFPNGCIKSMLVFKHCLYSLETVFPAGFMYSRTSGKELRKNVSTMSCNSTLSSTT